MFDSSYFRGKSYFEDDDTRNYLLFQPVYRYFTKLPVAIIFHRGNKKWLPNINIKSPVA